MKVPLGLGVTLLIAAACGGQGEGVKVALYPAPSLTVRVSDGVGGAPIPARLLLLDGDQPVRFGDLDFLDGARQAQGSCWIAAGALGTWDGLVLPWGEARIAGDARCGAAPALMPGRYRVWAWHGIEFERWEGEVLIGAGPVRLDIALQRAFTPAGALAADLHVHAQASPDSTVPAVIRAITLASAGVRVVALSDHNVNGDLDAEIRLTGLGRHLASIASNELSSDWAHVGVYPVVIDPAAPGGGSPPERETASWSVAEVLAWAIRQPGRPIVQVNHPRYRVYALFDLAGWDGLRWPPPFPIAFDALEVLSGNTLFNAAGDRRLDEGVRDFYTLIDHGALVCAVGNSDTHHLTWIRDGLTRSYVFVDDPRTEPFDEAAFVAAIRARRAVVTSGPWLDVEAVASAAVIGAPAGPGQALTAPGGKVTLDVEVVQAGFSRADRMRVLVGRGRGVEVFAERAVPPGGRWRGAIEVDLEGHDGWIGVDVGGDVPLPAEMTGDAYGVEGRPGALPFALINPVLVDGDGDGRVRYGHADRPVTAP